LVINYTEEWPGTESELIHWALNEPEGFLAHQSIAKPANGKSSCTSERLKAFHCRGPGGADERFEEKRKRPKAPLHAQKVVVQGVP